MTAAKLPFAIGERVSMQVRYADVVPGKFSEEVRFRGNVDGQMRTIYLGPTAEAITALYAGGALASLDVPTLAPGAPGAEITLAARDLVLERQPVPGTRRSRLLVQLAAAAPTPNGATPAAPSAAPMVASAAASIDGSAAKRETIVATFRAALDAAAAELVPTFVAAHLPVDADVLYKLGFSVWQRWNDHGAA